MKKRVFIDGNSGTTGLMIENLLQDNDEIELIKIQYEKRRDIDERLKKIEEADVTVLCLPDESAKEIAALAPADAKIIDTSTEHRVNPEWVYGMPELCKDQREKIRNSNRIANPGCHASGFILLIRPLIEAGLIKEDFPYQVTSLTGYSGGGKKMIADYEANDRNEILESPGIYALSQNHKHLPEMMEMTGVVETPFFSPIVSSYFSGMTVSIPLPIVAFKESEDKICSKLIEIYEKYYGKEALIEVAPFEECQKAMTLYGGEQKNKNGAIIRVVGNDKRPVVTISYDNLRKGASGSAIQNLNILLGLDELQGL